MTILYRVEYDRSIMESIGFEFKDEWLDNRTTFSQFPNVVDRQFLIEAVASGAFPAQRTPNDSMTITADKIICQVEWLDLDKAQQWSARKQHSPVPGVIYSEVVVI
jgi:hypothetical protein